MELALPAVTAVPIAKSAPTASSRYEDGPVRMFSIAAVAWGVVGIAVGVLIAAQLTWPDFN